MQQSYPQHLQHLQSIYEQACAKHGLAAILVHSGVEHHYFGDDRGVPFQAFGHFCHWLPVNRPDQFVLIRPGQRPTYFQVVPDDFWYDQEITVADWWADQFEVVRLTSVRDLPALLPSDPLCYLGEAEELADTLNVAADAVNPPSLLYFLDFHRAVKTGYELEQLREANRLALTGHEAARQSFLAGGNEFDIHLAYLQACQMLEHECPYTNIVALDEKAAILHYQHKRTGSFADSRVLLIDAGARVNNYGSDITRTTVKATAPSVFRDLLAGMEQLEQDLVARVRPGISYVALHDAALQGVGELLLQLQICQGNIETLLDEHIPQLFMPHGVGHLLGVQVHDVGGHQADSAGNTRPAPAHSPALRNTRDLQPDMVFTIEPGCYFIPLLLEPQKETRRGQSINWSRVDELYPCGGIRIEDNVRVTNTAAENLTRNAHRTNP